jgi:hypothetical protein
MSNLNINGFDIQTNLQHEINFSKDGSGITFRPADGEAIAGLLGSGARMQSLDKKPPRIQHLPFVLSFNAGENTLTLSRDKGEGKITFSWGELDGCITAVREAVKTVNNEITHRPAPRGGWPSYKSFGEGDPFV